MLVAYSMVFLSCFHVYKHWENTTPLQGSDREIVAADVWRFPLSDYRDAAELTRFAQRQKRELSGEVYTWNRPTKAWAWEQDSDWRIACWDALWDALNQGNQACWRIQRLYRLRELLGDEAYYRGQMPNPTPTYRIVTRD